MVFGYESIQIPLFDTYVEVWLHITMKFGA